MDLLMASIARKRMVFTQSMTVSVETSAGAATAARTGFIARAETRAETFLAALAWTFAPAKEVLSAAIWEAMAAIFPRFWCKVRGKWSVRAEGVTSGRAPIAGKTGKREITRCFGAPSIIRGG